MIKMWKKVTKTLRRLLRGKKYVREKQVLEIYQKALLNANRLLAPCKAAEVAPLRAEGKVEDAVRRNALDVLPPEMWAAVFDHLTDWNDLKSCYETCQLFRDLLHGTKNEWLFSGVFPIIQRHPRKLGTKQVLKCREICKAWKEEVDLVDHFPPLCHPVNIQVSQDGRERTGRQVEEMVNHGKSPFVGHIVNIWVFNGGDLEEDFVGDQERAAAVEDIEYFIQELGKHITGIWLNVTRHLSEPSDLCYLVLDIISKCHSLKMLRISGFYMMGFQGLDYLLSEYETYELTPHDFRLGPNFQSLAVDNLWGFWPIQSRILQLTAGQLKKLETNEWAPETSNFEMSALEELEVKCEYNVHEGLMHLSAPRLKKLVLPVNSRLCSLENLLSLTNRFPKIEHLHLNWSGNYRGFTRKQILAVPEGLEPPARLKILQLRIFQFNDKMNVDFLMFFPLLETLRLSHDFQNSNTEKGFVVQLSDHWLQESRIYESNVCEILPFLKMIMVYKNFYTFDEYDTRYDTVYSRKKYNDLKQLAN